MSSDLGESDAPHPDPPPAAQTTGVVAQTLATLRRLGPAAPMAIVVTVLPPIGLSILVTIVSTTSLATTMRDHPTVAMPIYVVAFWVLGLCALPTYAYSILGGWAFGFWPGFIASSLAYTGAMCGSFAIARMFAKARVLPLIDEHPTLAAVRHAVVDAGTGRGIMLIALLRISPASPFAITNAVLGAGGVGWIPYLVGSAIGVLPRTAVVIAFASRLTTPTFSGGEGWWMISVGIVATVIAVGVIGKLARGELDRQLKRPAATASTEVKPDSSR